MDVAPLAHAADVDVVLAQQLLPLAVAELVRGVLRRFGRVEQRQPLLHRALGLRAAGALADRQEGLVARRRLGRGLVLRRHLRARLGHHLAAARVLQPFPQAQVAGELAFLVIELGMLLVGLLLGFQRPVAHVLHRQGRGNHQHLGHGTARTRLQNHAPHARVQRQAGQLLAHGQQVAAFVHRAQLGQQLVAVGNGAARGRFQEREVHHIAQAQRLHAQDHAGQRAAQDFRVGEAGAAGEIGLVVQADANAVGHAATTAGALVGGRLADGLDQQLLHLATEGIALDARRACVNHVSDAGHRERGFGHVGGQHDAPAGVAIKDAVLLGLRQAREQRQHLGAAQRRVVLQVLAQVVGGLADLALARQEDQDVAPRAALPQLVHAIGDGVVQVVVLLFLEGPPAHLHRVGAARDHDHRRRPLGAFEVLGKAVGVDGGRGHHHLQVRALGQNLLEVAQQEVDVQAAFVRLVDDQRVVGAQQGVGLRLGQQDAVRHQLDRGALLQRVLEAHLVAHHLAQRGVQFLGNALGHGAGRNPARLRVADQAAAHLAVGIGLRIQLAPPQRQGNLGQLRGLARAGLATDDDDLVALHGLHDFGAAAGDWE